MNAMFNADVRVRLLGADPVPWVLQSDESAARWTALTHVVGSADGDPAAIEARTEVMRDAGTRDLLDRLPDWEQPSEIGGHDSPRFAPNLLLLLVEMGMRAGDDERLETTLDAMLRHQADDGRFLTYARWRSMTEPVWAALPCDHHAIVEALVRFGRGDDPRVAADLEQIAAGLVDRAQGPGWLCVSDPLVPFRGPGRKADVCPQVTLEALRTFARLPEERRPAGLLAAARTCLRAWRTRGEERPYMFGHGRQFKTVKWPPTWYGAFAVLDALGRLPEVWSGQAASADDRRAVAEFAACLIAYNVGDAGRVTPLSCFKGFESFSWGQKKQPSRYATARLLAVLAPFAGLADEIVAVDVMALGSWKGGRGTPQPPKVKRTSD